MCQSLVYSAADTNSVALQPLQILQRYTSSLAVFLIQAFLAIWGCSRRCLLLIEKLYVLRAFLAFSVQIREQLKHYSMFVLTSGVDAWQHNVNTYWMKTESSSWQISEDRLVMFTGLLSIFILHLTMQVLLLMRNLSINLSSPEFKEHVSNILFNVLDWLLPGMGIMVKIFLDFGWGICFFQLANLNSSIWSNTNDLFPNSIYLMLHRGQVITIAQYQLKQEHSHHWHQYWVQGV